MYRTSLGNASALAKGIGSTSGRPRSACKRLRRRKSWLPPMHALHLGAQISDFLLMDGHEVRMALGARHVDNHNALLALDAVRYPGGF